VNLNITTSDILAYGGRNVSNPDRRIMSQMNEYRLSCSTDSWRV
jgi:hypothetical protein